MTESYSLNSISERLKYQMVLGVFKYLVEQELRKNIQGQQEFRCGCQEGMIAAMVLMFGEADTSKDDNKTWLHIVREIQEELRTWVDKLESLEDYSEINFEGLQDAIDEAVNDYALKHPKALKDLMIC